ncbi:hypothetical protein PoB_003001500 [Plakobranchus ocellatus]|uniref:Uncharacterized protein n=1 Tax=Plakobranchus ocellatus TaxID=259542 RepID=A0AAV4A9P4_9GAST|nr:hypothetical protein PoB_003001500 [Plakobranchus ocellatus]
MEVLVNGVYRGEDERLKNNPEQRTDQSVSQWPVLWRGWLKKKKQNREQMEVAVNDVYHGGGKRLKKKVIRNREQLEELGIGGFLVEMRSNGNDYDDDHK